MVALWPRTFVTMDRCKVRSLRLLSLFLLLAPCLFAQEKSPSTLTFDIYVRSRGEYRSGYKRLLLQREYPVGLFTQRSQLGAKFSLDDRYEAYIALQDGRAWGQGYNEGQFWLSQAWGKVNILPNLFVQLGRQPILIWRGWLFSAYGFAITARSHDAVHVSYKPAPFELHAYASINSSASSPLSTTYYKRVNSLYWGMLTGSCSLWGSQLRGLSVVDVTQNPASPETLYSRATLGFGGIFASLNELRIEAYAYYQFGRTYHRELKEMHPVGAYAFDAYADVRLSADFAVGAIAHMVSGHDPLKPRTERFGQFDRLFGSGHNYFGYTDLFSITMQQANYQGMWHAGLVGRYRHKGLKLELTTSYLWLDRTAPRQQPGIGCEVSLVGAYKLAGCCQLEGGYVVLFPSATTRAMRAAEPVRQPAQFAYLSMLLTMTH